MGPRITSQVWHIDHTISFGYNIARMPYEIILSPEAVEDLRSLKANWRATVHDAIKKYLRHTPTKESKSRIKRLRGISHPHYRLRVDEVRVFYDVSEETVEILGIVSKSEAEAWLERVGKQNEANSIS
jgi:mRNA-degrading endonuclease RelE of RelBE toxin-antitoxin system